MADEDLQRPDSDDAPDTGPDTSDEQAAWDEIKEAEAKGEALPAAADDDGEDDPTPSDGEGEADQDGEDQGKAAADAAPNPWDKADPALKAEYDALQAALREKDQQYQSLHGRLAPTQRRLRELETQLGTGKKAAPKGDDDADDGDHQDADEDPEIRQFREEYPEIAGPVLARMERFEAELAAAREGRQESYYAEQGRTFTEAHPDYLDVAKSPAFKEWIGAQPVYVQEAFDRNRSIIVDAEEAGDIIQRFKDKSGWKSDSAAAYGGTQNPKDPPSRDPKRQRQLKAAAAPRTNGPGPVSDGPPNDEQGAWDYFKEQDRRAAAAS